MEALSEYLNYVDYLPTIVAFLALFHCWKDVGARWLIITALTIGCIDNYSVQYAINWTTHYYAWAIFVNLLYILPILYRKKLARKIYNSTNSSFFYEASQLKFSPQEAAGMLICSISIIGNAISYVEIFLYKGYVIDVLYFKSYALDKLQFTLHILSTLVILSFFYKAKGLNYETGRA